MSTQITLTLSDETYSRAQQLAKLTKQDVTEVMAHTLTLSLPQLTTSPLTDHALEELTDSEVLQLCGLTMPPAEDRRLTDLLDQQQAGILQNSEKSELTTLMQLYQSLLIRQATALAEAVRRGLRPALTPSMK